MLRKEEAADGWWSVGGDLREQYKGGWNSKANQAWSLYSGKHLSLETELRELKIHMKNFSQRFGF